MNGSSPPILIGAGQLAWVREGAGERFDTIELNQFASFLVSDHRRARTEEFMRERGWTALTVEDAWAMPSVLAGSLDQIAEDMERWREELGFSYYLISDTQAEALAPLVAHMNGR